MKNGSRRVQRGGLKLLWVVDSAVAPITLPEQRELKAWHVDVYGNGMPPQELVSFSKGPQGKLVAKHRFQTAAVADSLQVYILHSACCLTLRSSSTAVTMRSVSELCR